MKHMIIEMVGDIWDSLHNPQQRHAMMVHLPIAISFLAVPMSLALLVTWGKTASMLRWLMVVIFILGAGVAWITVESGESAMESSMSGSVELSPEADTTLHDHREMAEKVGLFFFSVAVLSALSGIRFFPVRLFFKVATVIAAIAATGWVAGTAHYGGLLVYEHGLGVPTTESNLPDKDAPADSATQPAGDAVSEIIPQVLPAKK